MTTVVRLQEQIAEPEEALRQSEKRHRAITGTALVGMGISDAVAESIVDPGIDRSSIETLSDLQIGLITALGSLDLKLTGRRGNQQLGREDSSASRRRAARADHITGDGDAR